MLAEQMKTLRLLLLTTVVIPMGCAFAQDQIKEPSEAQIQKSIDFHNRAIAALASNPIPLVVRCSSHEIKADGSMAEHKKELRIVDTNDCRRIFRALKTEDRHVVNFMHVCAGHIKICFRFEGQEQIISFDHGVGITSTLMSDAAFRELPKKQCEDLIKFLEERGFTKHQMGMEDE